MKRVLSALIVITLLLGNTMSVSATSSSMVGEQTEVISTEDLIADEEKSGEDLETEIEDTEVDSAESEMESVESSEEADIAETEAVSEEIIEETTEAVTETTMEESTEVLFEAGVLSEQPEILTESTSTDKVVNRDDVPSSYQLETPLDVSGMSYTFKSESDGNVSSLNSSSTKYRLLLFAPVEAFRDNGTSDADIRGMWEEFYMYNSLLLEPDYVDTVILDTGRSAQSEIKAIHKAAKTFNSEDASVFCYDTTESEADNKIWQAYNAYCDLFEIQPATHWVGSHSGETTPCAVYFLINEKNEVVLYGYGAERYDELLWYIQDDAIVKPPAPDNIIVTNMQGEVTFSWIMEDEMNFAEAYRVMLDEAGNEIVDKYPYQYDFEYDGKKVTFVEKTDATGDEDNWICRYQFREIHDDKHLVKSEYSATYSNEGMDCPRNPELIKEARFVDTRISDTTDRIVSAEDGITIHVGETVKMDIEIERYSEKVEKPDALDRFHWYMATSPDGGTGIITDGGPVKYWVDSFEDMTGIYVKGEELTEETTYYMVCNYWDLDSSFYKKIVVPVYVVAAEEGVIYDERETESPTDLYISLESLREAVTTHLKNGDEVFTVTVSYEDWDKWGVSVTTLDMPQAFWDEEPWTLNYSYIFGGTIWSPTFEEQHLSVQYKMDTYYIYKFFVEYDDSYGGFYAPYEWFEGQVDKLVNQPGGALYEYKNADEYTRIKAVYNWVRKNVSYKGTTDGLYHSAYGAMKTKKATCEGYQQLTYRLLWEMGIPNGCMTDNFSINATIGISSVHAYNMVELEGKAYYLDTSSGLFLKGTKSVGPRDYQEYFYDDCKRFIDILSEEDYVYIQKNLQLSKTIGDVTTSMESFNSFAKVKEAIDADIVDVTENGETPADCYSIRMTGNMELSNDSLNNSDIKINLDLNGHTLNVTGDVKSTAYIYGGSSKIGSVKLAENAIFIVEATDKETEVEKVTFTYEGTNSTLILGSEASEQTLTLKDIVSGTANHLKIFGDVEYTGSMTAQKLTLEKGQLTAGVLTVKGDTIATSEHKLLLSGDASFKNMTVVSDNVAPMEIGLFYSDDDSKKGALKFTGGLINSTTGEYAVILKKYDCTCGTPIQKEFISGEKIATVTIATEKFDESNICINQNGFYAERDGNNLLAAIETVEVSYYDEKTGTTSRKIYSSLKNAIAGLNTLAGKAAGAYTFTFVEDCMLSADATLPSFVKEAVFTTADEVTLDFNGFKVKAAGNLTLDKEELVLTKANIDAGTLSIPAGNRVLDTVAVKVLDLSEEQAAKVSITTLKASTAIMLGTRDVLRVHTATGIKDVELNPGALLIADNFTQISSGKTYAWADSVFVVNETATIYNPILNADIGVQEPVHIYKTEAAKINLLGKLTRTAPQTLISVGTLAQNTSTENGTAVDIANTLQDYTGKTALFDTKISKFPLDVVKAEQASAGSTSEYNVIYQIGTTIYVGKIVVKALGTTATGAIIEEKGFAKWSDAIAYLNTYAHAKAKFEIGVLEDFDTGEKLTMPKKAAGIWIYGGAKPTEGVSALDTEESVSLTYLGDISLVAETTIANIDLRAKKYNSKLKDYEEYKSALKLNGKALSLTNVSADLTNVAGNAKAVLTLDNAEIAVTKAVSSLGYLYMTGSSLTADNVTVTNTLSMNSARIDCVTKITLNNVISESEDNVLAYGGNTSKNNLTIKGNVTFSEDADKTVNLGRKDNEQIIIRKNAITLKVKSMEPSSYTEGTILCNAQKAGSSWFVVGSEWDEASERTAVVYGTYKKNKNIFCGELDENVNLYSSKSGNKNSYVLEGGFATLQDALSEIDKLAIAGNYYQIELMKSDKDVVTFTNKALTFPSKTAGITIMADSSVEEALQDPKIYFKGNLTLKSNTTFEEIVFSPVKDASVSLGNFSLTLSNCSMNPEIPTVGFSQISGSGVKKNSALILDDTALTVLGNVNNVGNLVFAGSQDEAELISYGTVNVGNVELNTDATLGGLATVTRKKVSGVNTVTKIASKITINGDVVSDNGSTLYLDLYEKIGKVYKQLDFDASDMDTVETSGIQMAKGLLVTYPNVKAFQRNNETSLIKSAGYLLWYPNNHETGESEHGAELRYTVDNEEVVIPCLTIGDAVTEINNQKVKRDYIITLTKAGNETSGAVQNGTSFVPKALKMPTSKYINSLVLEGKETSGIKLGYLSNITFTCDTKLCDIDFVQMVKVKNKYLTMDEAKANYPAAVTVNTGGFALNIEGMVTFNTPLTLNGKNTGTLTLNGEGDMPGTIVTLTNQNDEIIAGENVIYGSVTAFKDLEVNQCNLMLKEYKTSATSNSYKASVNKVTNLRITDGTITVVDERAKSSFTVTGDTVIDSGNLIVGGKVSLKNVELSGNNAPTIKADTDFTISGTLTSKSNNTTLETRRKGVNKAPYLNIKGEVILDKAAPIYVGVYNHIGFVDKDKPVKLTNAPQVTAQLLTAANASANLFRPIDVNTNGHGPYSESNTQGYWLSKVKSNIYVYEGK